VAPAYRTRHHRQRDHCPRGLAATISPPQAARHQGNCFAGHEACDIRSRTPRRATTSALLLRLDVRRPAPGVLLLQRQPDLMAVRLIRGGSSTARPIVGNLFTARRIRPTSSGHHLAPGPVGRLLTQTRACSTGRWWAAKLWTMGPAEQHRREFLATFPRPAQPVVGHTHVEKALTMLQEGP